MYAQIMHFMLNFIVFSLFSFLYSLFLGGKKYQYQNWYYGSLILIFDIFNQFDVDFDIDILIPKHIDISIIDIWYWYIKATLPGWEGGNLSHATPMLCRL